MRTEIRGSIWFSFYRFLILFPLIVGAVFRPSGGGRGFLLSFAVACGYVGLAMVALEFALVARLKHVAGAFGQDALQQFHKQMGYASTAFLVAHPVLLFVCGFPMNALDPFTRDAPLEWRWGSVAFYVLVLLVALSVFRKPLRMSYEWWQLTHRLLSLAVLIIALIHIFEVNDFTGTRPMRSLWIIYAAGLLGITVYHRVYMPLRTWQRPWTVIENREELGSSRTLILRPVGHSGIVFEPGQFAWLSMGSTPFQREEHPVSFSSSAENPANAEVRFTIKALGNWSSNVVPRIAPGTRVWIDGPYGVFTPDREQGPGYVLIGGGVGVTPLYSMCQTLADREDMRPVYLFYGRRDFNEITFQREIEALKSRMNLKVVYVLEQPGAGWDGERGFINEEILRRYLPKQYKRFQYFICGPLPMMDAMERLLPAMGIPAEHIHTERFDIV